jgi:hypothetical protein
VAPSSSKRTKEGRTIFERLADNSNPVSPGPDLFGISVRHRRRECRKRERLDPKALAVAGSM